MKYLVFSALLFVSWNLNAQRNGDCEMWDSLYPNPYQFELDTLFSVQNPMGGNMAYWKWSSGAGASRTTDSYSGNYALILHNWYGYAQEWGYYNDTLSWSPAYFQGQFKYITGLEEGMSRASIDITLRGNNGDTIATGFSYFDSNYVYTPFQVELNYRNSDPVDSVHIVILNSDQDCQKQIVCHLLYLDDMRFSSQALDLTKMDLQTKPILVSPNPATQAFSVSGLPSSINHVNILSVSGQLMRQYAISSNTLIKPENLLPGTYLLEFSSEEGQRFVLPLLWNP